jgi:hypothetical protein
MRFALALLGLIAVPFASAVAVPHEQHDIAARSADELDPRGLDDLYGGWKDKWDNKHCGWKVDDCSKKGKKCSEWRLGYSIRVGLGLGLTRRLQVRVRRPAQG